jgi:hypothetical protein
MTRMWQIVADWEALDEGSVEERSCFAALGIEASGVWLTEGRDALANRLRRAPLLSAYHLAEWFVWNWWRLRWEPRASSKDWEFAHKIANIGGGYIWPNVTIFSDGERTALVTRASRERTDTPFRYITDFAAIVSSADFEVEVDNFVGQALERLEVAGVNGSNLSRLWADVSTERSNPELARIRKLEALMGKQPDELSDEAVSALVDDSTRFGESAINELAADRGQAQVSSVLAASELLTIASRLGFSARPADGVRLASQPGGDAHRSQTAAWRLGASVAKSLRDQERLGDAKISNDRLADLIAVDKRAVGANETTGLGVSFLVNGENDEGRVGLRSRWESGRRFELARLLGDELMYAGGKLFPATRAYTYRQKAQRSFAAELLSPFRAVLNMLQGDFSQEKQLDVAEYFGVSEITIRTQLMNHKILEREDLEFDLTAVA